MVQLGVELGLWRAMVDSELERSWAVGDLAAAVDADDTLLYRVLRKLFTLKIVTEDPDGTYGVTDVVRWLATDAAESDVRRRLVLRAFPLERTHDAATDDDFSKTTSLAISESLPDILQRQRAQLDSGTSSTTNASLAPSPLQSPRDDVVSDFVTLMRTRRQMRKSWMDVFPMPILRLSGRDYGSGRINFVQIGKAWDGEQCLALRTRSPGVLGNMVLQVPEAVVARTDQTRLAGYGVSVQVHDPSRVQPVIGAKAYYLKNFLHDLSDERCLIILQRLAAACAPDSFVLIDEMILQAGDSQQKNLQMLSYLTAMERTRAQWEVLLTKAGLQLRRVYTYDAELGDSVIVAVKS
ncbi:hypothetical protein LTR56_010201 [Elasticomyces elasticus]|nr:hypothetical protein LTR56_010201 [Elasticomyces elasticus]KAK5761300.1 hypothetical protein LTS12_008576 [Elasticomyces elasticus]